MSDKRVSENGKRVSEVEMRSAALLEAATWADELMNAEWRGRGDREGPVRYRVAKSIGVSESYLYRLKYKLEEMTDVRGSVYRALLLGRHAYGLLSEAGENKYQEEKALADARNSKVAGLARFIHGQAVE